MNKREYQIFFNTPHNLDNLISKVTTDYHATPIRFSQSVIDGQTFGGFTVYLCEALRKKIGGMVYGDSNISKKYYLQLIKTNAGQYQLFVKYNQIIGSRRVAVINPDSLIGFVQ